MAPATDSSPAAAPVACLPLLLPPLVPRRYPSRPAASGRVHPEPVGSPLLRLPPSLAFHPPERPTWMPSALLTSPSSRIPPRTIRTQFGRGKTRSSLRSTPPCDTLLLAGHHLHQTTSLRASLRTCAPPSRSFISSLAKAGYTPSRAAPSYSYVNRLHNPRPTRSTRWDARLVCGTMSLLAFTCGCSCVLG